MKVTFNPLFTIFVSILFLSCSALDKPGWNTNNSNMNLTVSDKLKRAISSADFNVYNIKVLRNIEEWNGKIVSIVGVFYKEIYLKPANEVISISGNYNKFMVNFILYLDNPLPDPKVINDNMSIINNGKLVRVFGVINGQGEFVSEGGTTRTLPTLKCIAIFNSDDNSFSKPLWVSKFYL